MKENRQQKMLENLQQASLLQLQEIKEKNDIIAELELKLREVTSKNSGEVKIITHKYLYPNKGNIVQNPDGTETVYLKPKLEQNVEIISMDDFENRYEEIFEQVAIDLQEELKIKSNEHREHLTQEYEKLQTKLQSEYNDKLREMETHYQEKQKEMDEEHTRMKDLYFKTEAEIREELEATYGEQIDRWIKYNDEKITEIAKLNVHIKMIRDSIISVQELYNTLPQEVFNNSEHFQQKLYGPETDLDQNRNLTIDFFENILVDIINFANKQDNNTKLLEKEVSKLQIENSDLESTVNLIKSASITTLNDGMKLLHGNKIFQYDMDNKTWKSIHSENPNGGVFAKKKYDLVLSVGDIYRDYDNNIKWVYNGIAKTFVKF